MIEIFKLEFINGIQFQKYANHIIDFGTGINISIFKNGDIIWCKTELIAELFLKIANHDNKYILITHCCDHEINDGLFNLRPKSIVKWFAQNVNFKHNDLIPLPLGIENHIGHYKGSYTNHNFLFENIKYNIVPKIMDKIYCNFNCNTNRNRNNVLNSIRNISCIDVHRSYNDYCNELSKFMFIASPRGNGIDCHRTWEALYMGSIPIVENYMMYDSYKDLPIIVIDNWNDVTIDSLNKKYHEMQIAGYSYEKLKMSYWVDLIRKEQRKIL